MKRRLLWLALTVWTLASCREVIGVEEAALDPALVEAAAGAGGEAGLE